MFIKIKGYARDEKDPNIQMEYLVNIHLIRTVIKRPLNLHTNKYAVYTVGNTVYTDDDVPALIEKRMATPFSEPFLAVEKQYREPVLPQDLDCLAEFSDNNKDWEEGYLSAFSRNGDDQMEWGGRSLNKQFRYYKRCRIPV
jgi:hypothetical protein